MFAVERQSLAVCPMILTTEGLGITGVESSCFFGHDTLPCTFLHFLYSGPEVTEPEGVDAVGLATASQPLS